MDQSVDDFEIIYLPILAVLLSVIIVIIFIGNCVCCFFLGRRCSNRSEKTKKKQPMPTMGTTTLNNGPVLPLAPPQEPVIYMQIGAPTNTTTTIYCESKHYDYIRPDPDWRLPQQHNSTSTYV